MVLREVDLNVSVPGSSLSSGGGGGQTKLKSKVAAHSTMVTTTTTASAWEEGGGGGGYKTPRVLAFDRSSGGKPISASSKSNNSSRTPRSCRSGTTPWSRTATSTSRRVQGIRMHGTSVQKSANRLTRTCFRRLKKSKETLESKLAEKGEYVAFLQKQITLAKDRNLRKSIQTVSSGVFLVCVAYLLYCNYVMLVPHFNAIFMALLVALLIDNVRTSMVRAADAAASRVKSTIGAYAAFAALGAIVALCAAVFFASDAYASVALSAGALAAAGGLVLTLLLTDTTSFVSTFLTTVIVCTACVPMLCALKTCVAEIEVVTKALLGYMDNEDKMQQLAESIVSSSVYGRIVALAQSVSWELPSSFTAFELKGYLQQAGALVQGNLQHFSGSLLGVLAKTGNLLMSFTTFSTALFYLLQTEGAWGKYVSGLSPLSDEDNAEVYRSVKESASTILQSSACIGIVHALSTYFVLSATSPIPIIIVPSVASGMMAVMPLIGSYVVWLPIVTVLWLEGSVFSATVIASVEIFTRFYVDDLLLRRIPGNVYYVGLSVVAGMYTYGPLGFILGPLIVGMTITALDIYKKYLRRPLTTGSSSTSKGFFSPRSGVSEMTPRSVF